MSMPNEHGLSSKDYASLYNRWKNIKSRCYDENNKSFHNYGGRGICLCVEWQNDFHAFVEWALANGWSPALTIERIDNDGNYEPSNCAWVTRYEQARNLRKNVHITIDGETKCLADWCEIFNIPYGIARQRMAWSKTKDPGVLFHRGDIRELRPKIVQMDKDREFVAEYQRMSEAEAGSGVPRRSIQNVLAGRNKTAGGYYWKHA